MNSEPREVVRVPRRYAFAGQDAVIVPGSERGSILDPPTVELQLLRSKARVRVYRADLGKDVPPRRKGTRGRMEEGID